MRIYTYLNAIPTAGTKNPAVVLQCVQQNRHPVTPISCFQGYIQLLELTVAHRERLLARELQGSLPAIPQTAAPTCHVSIQTQPTLAGRETHLKLLRPFSDIVVVLARMRRLEIRKAVRLVLVHPSLTQDSGVDIAHQDLANGIEAVSFAIMSV